MKSHSRRISAIFSQLLCLLSCVLILHSVVRADQTKPTAKWGQQSHSKDTAELISQILGSVKSPRGAIKSIKILKQSGGRVSWSPKGDWILFDRKGRDGYYDLYLMRPDGSGENCLTCNTRGVLSNGHKGTAEWHPSGKYIVFQSQKKQFMGTWGLNRAADPGNGRNSDLWLMDIANRQLFQLTHTANTQETGVLHPHFSHNGRQLTWSQMYKLGNIFKNGQHLGDWRLQVADFNINSGKPSVTKIRSYQPGGPSLYENHGLSPDGRKILFTGLFESKHILDFFTSANIYLYDMHSKRMQKLAGQKYNEHAHYSPDDRKIIWMSSSQNPNKGTDYWSMNTDGSGKKRLTDFNNPSNPGFKRKMVIASDASFSPDGSKLVAFLQNGLSYDGPMALIELDRNKI